MKSMRILWVDDDWDQSSLQLFADDLANRLVKLGIDAKIDRSLPNQCTNMILYEESYALIITDHVFEKHTPPSNGAQIVEALSTQLKTVPPIILLTRYLRDPNYYGIDGGGTKLYYRQFTKDPASLALLADSIRQLSVSPPIGILILSDIHCGFTGRKNDERAVDFFERFIEDLRSYASTKWKIDYVVICGDLAWHDQNEDLRDAKDLLKEVMQAVGLTDPRRLHFCIGNHDVNLSNPNNPLDKYERFLGSMKSESAHYISRYMAYQAKRKVLGPLVTQAQSLYTDYEPVGNVVFASLNSCAPKASSTERGTVVVERLVGISQWTALEVSMRECNQAGSLKIALLHHPLFATPDGQRADEQPISDQAQAFHRLTKLGFQLAIHGHSHLACMYEQRMQVLNPSGAHSHPNRLVVIGAPTLSAEPSNASPSRQYMVLSIGAPEEGHSRRSASLFTRALREHSTEWTDGQSVDAGSFYLN